jgi:hypothetical protein
MPAVGDGEQVQERVLLEEPAVPARPRVRDRGEGPETLGQAGGLRVDHPGGDVVPVGVAGLLARGQALPHLVAEPPVELGQAGRDPGLALLGPAGRRPGVLGFGLIAGWGPAHPGSPGEKPGTGPVGRTGRVVRHRTLGPEQQQRQHVLARELPAGARAPVRRAGQVDHGAVRRGGAAPAFPPHRVGVGRGAGRRPGAAGHQRQGGPLRRCVGG